MELKLLMVAACLCTVGHGALTNEDLKRALRALHVLASTDEEERGLMDCKASGEYCNGVVPCCDKTYCYWDTGYDALRDGKCVKCVQENQKCQRKAQCCPDLQCDKGNALWMDGTCQKYRRSGSCYTDGQCVKDCVKAWYETTGTCQ